MNDERICRICFDDEVDDELLNPCNCKGSMKYIHRNCLDKWRIISAKNDSIYKCDVCHSKFQFKDSYLNKYPMLLPVKTKLNFGFHVLSDVFFFFFWVFCSIIATSILVIVLDMIWDLELFNGYNCNMFMTRNEFYNCGLYITFKRISKVTLLTYFASVGLVTIFIMITWIFRSKPTNEELEREKREILEIGDLSLHNFKYFMYLLKIVIKRPPNCGNDHQPPINNYNNNHNNDNDDDDNRYRFHQPKRRNIENVPRRRAQHSPVLIHNGNCCDHCHGCCDGCFRGSNCKGDCKGGDNGDCCGLILIILVIIGIISFVFVFFNFLYQISKNHGFLLSKKSVVKELVVVNRE
eukprot:TRINITY_DN1045_c2_g1_i1.p1 TRINITY_DN1045_c2_g1~~TRINITY_DN1045_c2_g1_i1.p1  ORF type:complete len:351 (+),score=39.08 TRINITY_DN1045_c2_g1_i1:65-1117(+)